MLKKNKIKPNDKLNKMFNKVDLNVLNSKKKW
jgi:hypothetical protein